MTDRQVLFNKTEVAEYLGISRQYLHRLEKHAKLPRKGYRRVGHITLHEVDTWVKENWTVSYYSTQKYFHLKQA